MSCNSLDSLLRPLQILLYLFRRLHAVCKVRAVVLEPALSQGLQFHQFAILSIEFAGSVMCQSNSPLKLLRLARQIQVGMAALTSALVSPDSYREVRGRHWC